jgi:formylglycine-generating enzyme required for sulfatase activity
LRIVRGGGWLVVDVRMLSCSHRHKVPPDTYSYGIGFRVVCDPE